MHESHGIELEATEPLQRVTRRHIVEVYDDAPAAWQKSDSNSGFAIRDIEVRFGHFHMLLG